MRTLFAFMLAACGTDPVGDHVGQGIYLVDRHGGDPVRVAAVDGDTSAIKFGLLPHGDGTADVAYVQDNDRNLYALTFDGETATPAQQKLARTDQWSLNGPAYCQARDELAVGVWRTTAVDVDLIDAETLRTMTPSSVDDAIASGALSSLQPAPFQISTDLGCGNLPSGAVYNFLDCAGRSSVDACLSSPGVSRIDYKPSLAEPAQRLTFPELDLDVQQSPDSALVGDNGPAVFVADDASMHVMFERDYANATSLGDPEFQPFGFNKLMYKHISGDPSGAIEYELDFSRWLARPAPLQIVNSSSVRADNSMVDFLALGVFKTPDPSAPYDDTVFMGIVAGQFDDNELDASSPTLVLDPARVQPVITFDRFTCYAWRTYGMSSDGNEVDMYALAYPQFLDDRVVFSATKYRVATLADGMVTYSDGSTETAEHLNTRVCQSP